MQDNSRKYIKAMLGLFCAMFLILCVYLVYIVGVYGNRWFTSPYNTRVQAQKNSVQAGRIADRNGQFVWAEAEIDGDTVVVRADGIPAPQAVRYAWASYPGNANLFNREGFPAAPFRTDRPDYLLKQSCSTCEKEYRHEEQ